VIHKELTLGVDTARPGDVILVNGLLGDHGAAILCARDDMALDTPIESDCACLHGLIEALLLLGGQAPISVAIDPNVTDLFRFAI
jgi:hydrogenase expression/formation protein HypE